MKENLISRREFLGFGAFVLGATSVPKVFLKAEYVPESQPQIEQRIIESLPEKTKAILELTPRTFSLGGNYYSFDGFFRFSRLPLCQTEWNRQKNGENYKLREDLPWAIVLHATGDLPGYKNTDQIISNAFDSPRIIFNGMTTITSPHALIGDKKLSPSGFDAKEEMPSIVQTQRPFEDGTPLTPSALRSTLDIKEDQYFSAAYKKLAREYGFDENNFSVLTQIYSRPFADPNTHTINYEITGEHFDSEENWPSNQKIANTLSLVVADMKAWKIPAIDIYGHQEIQLNKVDPGKVFTTTIRYLVGVKAIIDKDSELKSLTFGPFLRKGGDIDNPADFIEAVRGYFSFIEKFFEETTKSVDYYTFQKLTGGGFIYNALDREGKIPVTQNPSFPIKGEIFQIVNGFLNFKSDHEGIDIVPTNPENKNVYTIGPGRVLFAGKRTYVEGGIVLIKHLLANGAEVVSLNLHLEDLKVKRGDIVEANQEIGKIGELRHLHFAVAPKSTYQTFLKDKPYVPSGVGPIWIRQRFMNPIEFFKEYGIEVS